MILDLLKKYKFDVALLKRIFNQFENIDDATEQIRYVYGDVKKEEVKSLKEWLKDEKIYKVGDILMLKENLLLVKIVKIIKNKYFVIYPHLKNPHEFSVEENELEEKPINYEEKIFEAYIEYRAKYNELIDRLYSPKRRERY